MTGEQYYLGFVLVLTLCGFWWIANRNAGEVRSPHDFFHRSTSTQNFAGLVTASTTLGTGVGYLLVNGGRNGLLATLIPLCVIVGYELLARFTNHVVSPALLAHGTFFIGAGRLIEQATDRRSIYKLAVVAPLILVFVLLFCYEIFVSSQIIASVSLGSSARPIQMFTAAILFVATMLYAGYGARALFRTEMVQLVAITIFLLLLAISAAMYEGVPLQGAAEHELWKTDRQSVINVSLACLGAVTTQFYSLLNAYALSNMPSDRARKGVLRASSAMLAIIFATLIVVGAAVPLNWDTNLGGAIISVLNPQMRDSPLMLGMLGIVVIGLVSILLSTTQGLAVALTMFVFQDVLGRDAMSNRADAQAIRFAKRLMVGLFGIALLALGGMFYGAPSLFFLLLAIASGAEVFVPLILLIGYLSRNPSALCVLTNRVLIAYTILFVSALVVNLSLSVARPTLVPYVGLGHLLASAILTGFVCLRGNYLLRKEIRKSPLSAFEANGRPNEGRAADL